MAITGPELEKEHSGHHLKRVRTLLNVKQCRVAENTEQCDSTISYLERVIKNPKFYIIQGYLKVIVVEFYAFVHDHGLSTLSE
jgi:transcriptional regulator with XRE-family HTH domain